MSDISAKFKEYMLSIGLMHNKLNLSLIKPLKPLKIVQITLNQA